MKPLLVLLLAAMMAVAALPSSLAAFTSTSVNGQTVASHPDWTPPVVTLTVPAGPLRGTVTTQAAATDARSAVTSVQVQTRATGTTTWITRCTLPGAGGSCAIATAVNTDGTYELRAVATDTYSNVGTSAVLVRVFDNTPPTVTLADPGALLHGVVTLTAAAGDTTSGVASVRFFTSPASGNTWTERCATSTAPYTCALDTRTLPDGLYDLRALATDHAGNQTTVTISSRRVDNSPLAVSLRELPDAVRGTVTVIADVSTTGTSPVSVTIQRRLVDTASWTIICTTSTLPYQCAWNTTNLTAGDYELRATATNATTSATSALIDTTVDNAPPTVTMQDPGSPLSGSVDLRAAAMDATSGVASVTIQIAPQGTSNWGTVCVATTTPYTCRIATTSYTDGLYAFRAIAVDVAGNTQTSTTVTNRRIDNTVTSVSLADPGELLRGSVDLLADANSSAGIASVTIQRSPAGSGTWATICTVATAPYGCEWDTRAVADGLYDLRAVLVDSAGRTTISTVVAGRRVDNSPVRGVDVQAFNRAGGTLGRLEAGDRLVLTYSRQMDPTSFIAGWTGADRAIVLRLRDGKLLTPAGGSKDDTIDLFTTTALTTPVNVGTVKTMEDHIKGGKVAVFNATLSQRTVLLAGEPATELTITLGTLASGDGLRTPGGSAHMLWTPSVLARDIDGVATSDARVTESGPLDRDF